MNVLIAGGTGFLGSHLIRALTAKGDRVTILTRRIPAGSNDREMRYVVWDGRNADSIQQEVRAAGAIVNLAGMSIGGGRWTQRRKQQLEESRLVTTETLVEAMEYAPSRPSVFLNASAVGYYGECGEDEISESRPSGSGFLASLCARWETAALRARQFGMRVVLPRTAVVLAPNAEALRRMVLPYSMFLGGPLGSGKQWFPWIHIDDVVDAIVFALGADGVDGPLNVVAPGAVRMDEFAHVLGKVLRRPSMLRVPAGLLSMALGEMAEMLLVSQHVVPGVLLRKGFRFRFPTLGAALRNVLPS